MKRKMSSKCHHRIKYCVTLKVLPMMPGHLNNHLLTVWIIIFTMIGLLWLEEITMIAKLLSRVMKFSQIRPIEQMTIINSQRIKHSSLIRPTVKIILRVVTNQRALCQTSHLQQVPRMRTIEERWMSSKRLLIKFIEKKMHSTVKC